MKVIFVLTGKMFVNIYVFDYESEKPEEMTTLRGDPRLMLENIKEVISKHKPEKLFLDRKGLGTSYTTALIRWHKKMLSKNNSGGEQ